MSVTVRDIAKKLNIGKSTVGYALNGGPKPVSEEVRKLVLSAAKEMGYRPNETARALAKGRTNMIGIVPFQLDAGALASPFIRTALSAIYDSAERAKRHVVLFTGYDPDDVEGMRARSLEARVDGVILIAPRVGGSMLSFMAETGVPLAIIAGSEPSPGLLFNANNAEGARLAVQHLLDLGHRKIGTILGNPDALDGREREQTVGNCLKDAGLTPPIDWTERGSFLTDVGYEAAVRLLRKPNRPTAILAANDLMAVATLRAARELGLDVPRDLSVIGFDDEEFSAYTTPPLTTIRQPVAAMATAALEAVVALIQGEQAHGQTFPIQLIVRASTASPKED